MRLKILRIVLLGLCASLVLGACKKEDDCTAPALSANIIGDWSTTQGDVEFKSDGTLVDPNDAIIGGSINGTILDVKTYMVRPTEDSVFVRAANGALFVESTLPVTSNECDKISLSIIGFSYNLNRK